MNPVIFTLYSIIICILFYIDFRWQIHALLLRNRVFSCRRCGQCCSLIVTLTDRDIKRINAAGKKDFYTLKGKTRYLNRTNGYCYFLLIKDGSASCAIYTHRPDVCRNFPTRKVLGVACYDPRCCSFHKKDKYC